MKIKRKEKTMRTYKIALAEKEMLDLFNELYEIMDSIELCDSPCVFDLMEALRSQVHGS